METWDLFPIRSSPCLGEGGGGRERPKSRHPEGGGKALKCTKSTRNRVRELINLFPPPSGCHAHGF